MSDEEFKKAVEEFKKFQQEMRDPIIVGAMLNKLSEEKTTNNAFLKRIDEKLEKLLALETRLARIEEQIGKPVTQKTPLLLSDTDDEIVSLIAQKGKACAEDVQKQFNYKGANAASARLNNLVRQGMLQKVQAGKKVYFLPQSQQLR